MAVAAYASLLNLAQSLDRLRQLRHNGTIAVDKHLVHDLRNKARISLQFLEALPHQTLTTPEMEKLTGELKAVGVETELLVDGAVVGQLRGNGYGRPLFNRGLLKLQSLVICGRRDGLSSLNSGLCSVIRKIEKLIEDMKCELGLFLQNKVKFLVHSVKEAAQFQTLEAFAQEISIVAVEIGLLMDQFGDISDGFLSFGKALQLLIQKLESLEKRRLMIVDRKPELGSSDVSYTAPIPVALSSVNSSEKRVVVVGLEEKLKWISDELTSHEKSLQVIPIVGMGGIGKTTLARKVFEDPKIKRKFDQCLWCAISQDYNEKEILQGLLQDKSNEENRELGNRLYQLLHSRRYLIVLDDMWSIDPWEYLRKFLPDNGNKSRVIVTTRMKDVSDSITSSRKQCVMDLLDDYSSWNLLQETIFNGQPCPHEFEIIGRNIAENCKGLPISLVTIGGLISKSDMTLEYWENVADNLKEMAGYGDCMKVLSLSYSYLPIHLKPCFLYFRNYSEDSEIDVERLLSRWIHEGFVKPMSGKHIEEVAEEYMKDLINRNLIMVTHTSFLGDIMECVIHDLLRELCLSESQKEDFVLIPRFWHQRSDDRCCMCGSESTMIETLDISLAFPSGTMSATNVCRDCKSEYRHLDKSKFINFSKFGKDKLCMYSTTSRVAYFDGNGSQIPLPKLPLPVLYLWNLQVIILDVRCSDKQLVLPVEIWEMKQLRCLMDFKGCILPRPGRKFVLLDQLYELRVNAIKGIGERIFKRIPNLKKLHLGSHGFPCLWFRSLKLNCLQQLEVLELDGLPDSPWWSIVYPSSLKRLVIETFLFGEDMAAIGSLPNLEILELDFARVAYDWKPVRGQFIQLKVLKLSDSGINFTSLESDHFPNLEKLLLVHMRDFEIPSSIGDIPSLVSVHVNGCDDTVKNSALQLLEEQREYGNDTLVIYVDYRLLTVSDEDDEEEDAETEPVSPNDHSL